MFVSFPGKLNIVISPRAFPERSGSSLLWVPYQKEDSPHRGEIRDAIHTFNVELAPSPRILAWDSWELRVTVELEVLFSDP